MSVIVAIYINPKDAVLAGKAQSGRFYVTISQNELDQLDARLGLEPGEGRALLAESDALIPAGADVHSSAATQASALFGTEPNFDGVIEGLKNFRKEKERKQEAERFRQQEAFALHERQVAKAIQEGPEYFCNEGYDRFGEKCAKFCDRFEIKRDERVRELVEEAKCIIEQRNEAFRKARAYAREQAERVEQEAKEAEMRFLTALKAFIMQHGEPHHKERCEADALPEEEAINFLRDHLFKPFSSFARFERITTNELWANIARFTRVGGKYAHVTKDDAVFSAEETTKMPKEEWDRYKEICKAAEVCKAESGIEPTLKVRKHVGELEGTNSRATRYSCLVTLNWHGRDFSRALALHGPLGD